MDAQFSSFHKRENCEIDSNSNLDYYIFDSKFADREIKIC